MKDMELDAAPHNVDLEQQILGNVLLDNDCYHRLGMVRAEHFFDPVHAAIWKNVSARIERDHLASPVTVATDFDSHEGLEQLGGRSYLVKMAGAAVSRASVADYGRELVAVHGRRALLDRLDDVRARVSGGLAASDAQSELELFLHEREAVSEAPRSMSLLRAHTEAVSEINERYQTGRFGKSTGLKAFDAMTGGLHDAELTILAGATSMGKTAMGVWLAHAVAKAGYMVGFASIEMSETALANRLNAMQSGIPYQAMRGDISEATFRAVVEGAKAQEALPIHIYSDRVRDMASILSESKRLQRMHPPNGNYLGFGLLVIDYIQLVRGKGANTLEVLSRVAMDAKQVAKTLKVPVVALAQVARDLGKRDNPVPFLSDLRGAGDLENAADNVLFCHRPEYFLERDLNNPTLDVEARADLESALSETKGKMQIICAKQRMGAIGDCWVGVDMGTNVFRDLDKHGGWEF